MDEYQGVYSLPVEKIFSIYPLEDSMFWVVKVKPCSACITVLCGAFAENLMFSTSDFPGASCPRSRNHPIAGGYVLAAK